MRKFLKKTFEDLTKDENTQVPVHTPVQLAPPLESDIFRYRYQHGTNLGAIFCLERWLFGSMFDESASGGSELDAVKASLKCQGLEATRSKWEAHWTNALSDSDLEYLSTSAHSNCIRLPIGYFSLGPQFCTTDTPFSGDPSQVYINAWAAIRRLVERAHAHGIGTLLDLHAVPGGANGDEHSGTTSGQAQLWTSRRHRALALECLAFIAREARSMPGVIGIQAVNEACHGAQDMYAFYDSARAAVAAAGDPTMPLYISDAWDLAAAVGYSLAANSSRGHAPQACPVVVDTHRYWTFSADDTRRNPWDIIHNLVAPSLDAADQKSGNVTDHGGAVAAFVGEYSCVLAPSTWEQAPGDQHDALKRDFGQMQTRTWQAKAAGSAFWTYKMEWMDGGEWGFKQQSDSGNISPPAGLTLSNAEVLEKRERARAERQGKRDAAVGGHTGYWSQTTPGGTFEHWRYEQGWDLGWADAEAFWSSRADGSVQGTGAERIGATDLWVLKRMWETGTTGAAFAWEWEQGIRRGLQDWNAAVGI